MPVEACPRVSLRLLDFFASYTPPGIRPNYREQNRGEGTYAEAGAEGRRGVGYQRIGQGIGEGKVIIKSVPLYSDGSEPSRSI